MSTEGLTVLLFVLGVIFAIIGWLLRNKDAAQEEKIKDQAALIQTLFLKHDEDARRLDDLKLEIARKHYVKDELDMRFDRLETTTRIGFDKLTAEFKELARALLDHIQREDARLDRANERRQ